MRTLTARPTVYRGIQMRSRLEARFAQILDEAGVAWLYEPRAYASRDGQYLPDFQVGEGLLVEVKPFLVDEIEDAMQRMEVIFESDPHLSVAIWTEDTGYITRHGVKGRWERTA